MLVWKRQPSSRPIRDYVYKDLCRHIVLTCWRFWQSFYSFQNSSYSALISTSPPIYILTTHAQHNSMFWRQLRYHAFPALSILKRIKRQHLKSKIWTINDRSQYCIQCPRGHEICFGADQFEQQYAGTAAHSHSDGGELPQHQDEWPVRCFECGWHTYEAPTMGYYVLRILDCESMSGGWDPRRFLRLGMLMSQI